jgi:type III secretory pathway component EscS
MKQKPLGRIISEMKILVLVLSLPILAVLSIPGLLKHLFYNVSIITEEFGALFERIDSYLGLKSQKFFKWVKT